MVLLAMCFAATEPTASWFAVTEFAPNFCAVIPPSAIKSPFKTVCPLSTLNIGLGELSEAFLTTWNRSAITITELSTSRPELDAPSAIPAIAILPPAIA